MNEKWGYLCDEKFYDDFYRYMGRKILQFSNDPSKIKHLREFINNALEFIQYISLLIDSAKHRRWCHAECCSGETELLPEDGFTHHDLQLAMSMTGRPQFVWNGFFDSEEGELTEVLENLKTATVVLSEHLTKSKET